MEYVIKFPGTPERYLSVSDKGPKFYAAVSLQFASVFKSRERAQKLADQYGCKVELFLGRAAPQGTKFFTVGKQSPINRRSAYRNI